MKIRDPFPNKTKDKLKKANRVRFSFSGLWSPYLIFLGQTIIFTLSLVTKILVGYKSYLQKCLFLISRVIWWARWGGRGRGGGVGFVRVVGGIAGLDYLKFIGVHWVSFEFEFWSDNAYIHMLPEFCFSWKRFVFMFLLCILQSVCFLSLVVLAKNIVLYL